MHPCPHTGFSCVPGPCQDLILPLHGLAQAVNGFSKTRQRSDLCIQSKQTVVAHTAIA